MDFGKPVVDHNGVEQHRAAALRGHLSAEVDITLSAKGRLVGLDRGLGDLDEAVAAALAQLAGHGQIEILGQDVRNHRGAVIVALQGAARDQALGRPAGGAGLHRPVKVAQAVHVLGKGLPVHLDRDLHGFERNRLIARQGQHGPLGILRPQRGKAEAAVAQRHRRDSVPAADRAVGVPVNLGVIVGVQIDRARGDNQPAGVNDPGCIAGLQPADLGHPAVLDPQVGAVAWHLGAVDNRPIFDHHIKFCHVSPSFSVAASMVETT